jgi:hypothetical protein
VPALLAFLALAQILASLLAAAIHEVVGHGLVAEALGGEFVLFYLSPLRAWAYTVEPAGASDLVRAGGALAAIAAGVPVLWWLRTRRALAGTTLPLATLAWFFALATLVGETGYMSGEPIVRRLTGGEAVGDWDRIYQSLGIPVLLPLLVIGPVCIWLAARVMEEAGRMVQVLRPSGRAPDPLVAFLLLWSPGLVLRGAYAVALWDRLGGPERSRLPGLVAFPILIALAARAWLAAEGRIRRPRTVAPGSATASPPPSALPGAAYLGAAHPEAAYLGAATPGAARPRWGVHAAAVAVPIAAVLFVFGPVESGQRGVLVGRPGPDAYDLVAQTLTVSGSVAPGGVLALRFASRPRPDTGPPLRTRLTASLADVGPSREAATTITRFVADWNLDGASVLRVGEIEHEDARWAWSADVEPVSTTPMIRLWPLTMFPESHIDRLELVGLSSAESHTERGRVDDLGTRLVWTRGGGFEGIDSARVGVRAP